VAFYQEQPKNFEKEWGKYKTQTLVNLKYPEGYELDGAVLDLTDEFGCEHSGIRRRYVKANERDRAFSCLREFLLCAELN